MPRSDGTVIIDTKIDMSGLNKGTVDIGEQFGKIAASAKKLGATIASVFAIREIIQFGKESSTAAREMSDALMGLQSIVEGQGRSFGAAKNFIDEYISDGLVPATNAITAYKNLAMRGYDDMQIQKVLIALKDAAAFGRQAGLSLGDAIQGATEGLKNENSVLVDNAGVTKNVAKMWESYAESIGTTADKLTQQQKIQAEITGILEETKYQTGDAARVTGTLSGQLMKLQFGFNNLKIAVGNAINPIIQTFIPVINTAISVLTRFANTVAAVIGALFGSSFAKITSTAENVSSGFSSAAENADNLADATSGAGKAAQKSLASFDELNKLSDPNSGGGGGGGGGVSGAEIEMENLEGTIIEDSLSPQIQAIVNKIQELIAPLKEIDFTKAIKSIKEFGDAFVGLGKTIGKALESAWKTILVPLTKWAIEKGGPASVDLLTSTVKALTKMLDPLVDGFEILMDSMEPIFVFIGDSFIVILDELGGLFERIGDVFEEEGDTIRRIFENVGDVIETVWSVIEPVLEIMRDSFKVVFDFISKYVADKIEVVLGVLDGLTGFIAGVFTGDWDRAWAGVKKVFETITDSITGKTSNVTDFIGKQFNNAVGAVKTAWEGVSGWFDSNVVQPLKRVFGGLWDTITGIFIEDVQLPGLVDKVGGFFKTLANAIIKGFNNALIRANSYINQAIGKLKNFEIIPGVYPFSGLSYNVAPQIPYLAKGAVIPPHAPFMAMLGDQPHGTNIEAPLSTIQEAVALVMEDMIQSNIAGHEAIISVLRQILEAILGIEIGDSVIGEAVERYNQITRKARGTA